MAGEEVAVVLPEEKGSWHLQDYDGRILKVFSAGKGKTNFGKLSPGFYRLDPEFGGNWISLGVLEPLRAAPPQDSPICLDVAMAWWVAPEQMKAAANLCKLAGMNWVRDRLKWADMEPERGRFAEATKYDGSAAAQSEAGLKVLQVMHDSPEWANPETNRFPLDLRDAYRFYEAMARRWRGKIQAFEPWNEADHPRFGDHTGAEIASMQKAAYLGLKAGNSNITACLSVWALHMPNQMADLNENECWPYFDTYNLHHYEAFANYPRIYAGHRAISAGRPLWVTECEIPIGWGDPLYKDPTEAGMRIQAERVAKTFACSLYEGSAATFYFMLPHYVEGPIQFGILRPDLTPRPAFVALAAVGRLLAGARPLGRTISDDQKGGGFTFRALPDGHERDVLVAWSTSLESLLTLPVMPLELYDHLGRRKSPATQLTLTSAPVFAILPKDAMHVMPPPQSPPRLKGAPSTIVFQALWPKNKTDAERSAYLVPSGQPVTIPIYTYNFGSSNVSGRLVVEKAIGVKVKFPETVSLEPMERKELSLVIDPVAEMSDGYGQVKVRGDFAGAGEATLSLRIVSESKGL